MPNIDTFYDKAGASRIVKKNVKEVETKPYWENTTPLFQPEWIKYKQPEKAKEEDEEEEDEKNRPKGIALLKKVYGGCSSCKTSCKAKVNKRYDDVVGNYQKVASHLEEHIREKKYDKLDVEQSRHLRKEINRINQLHLVPANQVPKSDPLYKVSNPRLVQEKAKHFYGSRAVVYKSCNPKKKYQILNPDGKWVHFGDPTHEDFTKHEDLVRRHQYLTRALNIKGKWKENPFSPNWLAISLLW